MEIGHKRVNGLEAVARIDENVRPAAFRLQYAVFAGKALERPAGGCSDRDHSPAVCVRAVYDVRRLLTHHTEFRVHRVILDIVLLDRTECAESDVQRNIGERNAFIGDALQKLRREVQPRRRRRRGTRVAGIYRLVTLLVRQLFLDIRRQRHFAELVQ